jgi:ribosomal-protein-alanine N-acetyltransferase
VEDSIVLAGEGCRLRPYRLTDAEALQAVADDPEVARWMTAMFPYPYTHADAEAWIALAAADAPPKHFVIEAGGAFAGAVGIVPQAGEHAGCAVFGYWLGRRFWGRGLATDAARTVAAYALSEARGLRRLEATVFAPNAASARLLEKSGFQLEGRRHAAYVQRDGSVCDGLLYGRLATDPAP